jgi:hypothetical protein
VLAFAPFATGCAAEADEQGGPQFPHGEPIGTTGPAPEEGQVRAPYQQAPTEYVSAEPEPLGRETIVIGGDDAPEPITTPVAADDYADTDPSALTDFRAALDPYGQWVDDPTYGTIWQPSVAAVGSDFAPYESAGHWTYGDDYVWVSDYAWGWAPFHYGRWVYATNGWGWIPGRQYAGAWATWRRGYGAYSNYVGWAPLPPTYAWRGGMAVGLGVVPPAPYAFCNTGNLFAPSLAGRMIAGPEVANIGPNTRPTSGAVMSRAQNGGGGYGSGANGGPFGGRTVAHPEVTGPTPQSMHIAQSDVVRPPTNNTGLNRANQFAHPSTAMALGARGPAGGFGSGSRSTGFANGGVASRGGGASRAFASSLGTSAYGHYAGGFHGQSRTLGAGGGFGRPSAFGGPSGFHGGGVYYGAHPGLHGMGPHGPVVAPSGVHHAPEEYNGGYHPRGGRGGRGGGRGGGGHR